MRKLVAVVLAVGMFAMTPVALVGAEAQQTTGSVQGVAAAADKQPLANVTVRLRDTRSGQLVGSTTADALGQFSFSGINPGNFIIEIVDAVGNVLGTATASVTAGAVTTVSVTATPLGAAAAAAGTAGGLSGLLSGKSLFVIAAAAIAGITIAVVATKDEASPSR